MSDRERERGTIRLVSWNIHGTVGRAWKADAERTLREIERLAPDVLVLQEVDERAGFGRPANAFDIFRTELTARLIGTHADVFDHSVDGRSDERASCACGNLLWSRFAIRSSKVFALPGPDIETRRAIDAEIDAGGTRLRIVGTHLALLATTRLKQARAIRERLEDRRGSMPTILLGDLNEWSRRGWVHNTVSSVLPNAVRPRSWPEWCPLAPLDRLYASSDVEIVRSFCDREAGSASDHRPVVADVRIRNA